MAHCEWRRELHLDGGGVPRYWNAYLKKYFYIDVTNDTEFVYAWDGENYTTLTVMWWAWSHTRGRHERRVLDGYYPSTFDPSRS